MQLEIHLQPQNGSLTVPAHYNYLLQAALYRHIDSDLASYLHDKGFVVRGRAFKLFTFSRLFGQLDRQGDTLVYHGPLRLYVASPIDTFIQSLAQTILAIGSLRIGESHLPLQQIVTRDSTIHEHSVLVDAISPITVYSTHLSPTGSKKTHYYTPFESAFNRYVAANLFKKYQAFFGHEPPPDWNISLSPVWVQNRHQAIITYKGLLIKGWLGTYLLKGTPKLLAFALDAGLGGKNSQGFGMIEINKRSR